MAHLVRPALLLALLILAAQGVALVGGFVWDDRPLIVDNRLIKDPAEVGTILTSSFWQAGDRHDRFRSFFRPVVTLSYALDYAVWGLKPFGFHLTNLVIHWLCCLMVFRLATGEGARPAASLFGAALFAVHPVHVESVAWISGRTDLLCALFMLAAFALERTVRAGKAGRAARAIPVALFLLALFSKEMAATLPLLIFADRLLAPAGTPRSRLREGLRAAAPYAAALPLYLVARHLALGAEADPLFTLGASTWLATALFILARYATLLLLPLGLDAHYPYTPVGHFVDPKIILALIILALILESGRRLRPRFPRASFYIVWMFVTLLPVLKFGSFGDVLMADRFLYVPSAGLSLLVAIGLERHFAARGSKSRGERPARPSRPAWADPLAAACAVMIALLAGLACDRARVWRDDRTLFARMAATSPTSAMVRCNLGLALYHKGDYETAKREFHEAIRLAPGYTLAYNNLAAALERGGDLSGALAIYERALALAPAQIESEVNVGSLMVRLGQPRKGLELLQQTVAHNPRYPQALYALADALDRAGRPVEAIPYLDLARRIDPFFSNPHYLLGKILFEQGRTAEAAAAMQRFLPLWNEAGPYRDAALRVIARAAESDPKATRPPAGRPALSPAASIPPPSSPR